MNPRDFSLREYHERLRNKELSAEEGVQVFFDAIKKEDKKIHAFLSLREDEALREAKSIDQKNSEG
jgi:aspartyl-tRNA(Asn)/glutamyl-tRNA(Gln) amidotransferase subunit A